MKDFIVTEAVSTLGPDVNIRYIFAESWGSDWDNDDDYQEGENE